MVRTIVGLLPHNLIIIIAVSPVNRPAQRQTGRLGARMTLVLSFDGGQGKKEEGHEQRKQTLLGTIY